MERMTIANVKLPIHAGATATNQASGKPISVVIAVTRNEIRKVFSSTLA